MQRFQVSSSFIREIAYDARDGTMEVEFKDGRRHRYPNCNEAMVAEFVSSDSTGDYFNKKIKDLPHRRIDNE